MDLSERDRQQLKALLIEQKQALLRAGETGQQSEEIVELDQSRVGRLSRMDALQSQAMSQETGRRRRQYLLEIDAALKRLEMLITVCVWNAVSKSSQGAFRQTLLSHSV